MKIHDLVARVKPKAETPSEITEALRRSRHV